MKACGIVAEYNPFHNGHKYHIDYTRRELSCDYIIAVMSGSFVQRGAPAVIDKYMRARMALLGGADIVLELPAFYSLQSAQYFALGAVSMLNSLGIIDNISYGSEAHTPPQSDIIDFVSKIGAVDKLSIEEHIGTYVSAGSSYPLAYAQSLAEYLALHGFDKDEAEQTLSQPNTILELMYLEALGSLGSKIEPFKVARHGAGYHDKLIKGEIASATAIRRSIGKNNMYESCVPVNCAKIIKSALAETDGPVTAERFYKTFLYAAVKDTEGFSKLSDITGGLDMRMKKMLDETVNLDDYIKSVKTKSYTYVRVARAVFNLILGITAQDTELIRSQLPMYARVLGFKKEASKLIDLMHEKSSIPVFTQTSKLIPLTPAQKRLFEIDLMASDTYYIHAAQRFIKDTDYKNQVVII